MKPIINPLYFYFIDVFDDVEFIFCIALIVTFLAFCVSVTIILFAKDELDNDSFEITKKFCKTNLIVCIVSMFVCIFIPSKETCYQMIVANCVTPNNIEMTKDGVKDIVDYIIDSVDKLNDENEN